MKHKAAQSHHQISGSRLRKCSQVVAKHQHSHPPARPRQGSLGAWNSAHLPGLCPANTTGVPLDIPLLSPGNLPIFKFSEFTKSRPKDSVTPKCRNPCCPRKKGKDIYPTTAPPSQAAEASVPAKLPTAFLHPSTNSFSPAVFPEQTPGAGWKPQLCSQHGIFSVGTDPDAAEAEPEVKPELQKVCEH